MPAPRIEFAFPHEYQVEALSRLPMRIEEPRQFIYPTQTEEVERGALLLRVLPEGSPGFVAVFALGYDSQNVVHGIFSTPHPRWLCAVCGGYAYLVDVTDPQRWRLVLSRPVLEVRMALDAQVLLFVDFQTISGFTAGQALWQSAPLSWEGLRIDAVSGHELIGHGWDAIADREVPFTVDLITGQHQGGAAPKGAGHPARP